MAAKVFVGNYGFVVTVDFGDDDVSGADSYTLYVTKPDGTTTSWTAGINGSDSSQIQYTVQSGDLDTAGYYLIQPYIVGLGDFSGYGLTCRLQVHPLYD